MTFLQATKKETGNQLISWEGGGRKKKKVLKMLEMLETNHLPQTYGRNQRKKKKKHLYCSPLQILVMEVFPHGGQDYCKKITGDRWAKGQKKTNASREKSQLQTYLKLLLLIIMR